MPSETRRGKTASGKSGRSPPLYLVVADTLQSRIRAGKLDEDGRLPSENQLMKEFGISRVTVRQALSILETKALIDRRKGQGTFARKTNFQQTFSRGARTIVEALRDAGVEPEVKILGLTHITLSDEVRQALRTTESEGVALRRLYLHAHVPIALVTLYVPLSMAGVAYVLAQDNNSQETVYSIFEQKMDIGIKEAKYTVKTETLNDEDAEALHMRPGEICLAMDRVTSSVHDTPLEMMTYIYPPGRMQFEIIVPRDSSALHVPVDTSGAAKSQ